MTTRISRPEDFANVMEPPPKKAKTDGAKKEDDAPKPSEDDGDDGPDIFSAEDSPLKASDLYLDTVRSVEGSTVCHRRIYRITRSIERCWISISRRSALSQPRISMYTDALSVENTIKGVDANHLPMRIQSTKTTMSLLTWRLRRRAKIHRIALAVRSAHTSGLRASRRLPRE
jgi:hypothetical protein